MNIIYELLARFIFSVAIQVVAEYISSRIIKKDSFVPGRTTNLKIDVNFSITLTAYPKDKDDSRLE